MPLHDPENHPRSRGWRRAAFACLCLLLTACAPLPRQALRAPDAPPLRVFVEGLLVRATPRQAAEFARVDWGRIAGDAAARGESVSSPHVLATEGERVVLDLRSEQPRPSANAARAPSLLVFEVTPLVRRPRGPIRLDVRIAVSSDASGPPQTAHTTVIMQERQLVVLPLASNRPVAPILLLRAEIVADPSDLQRILDRRRSTTLSLRRSGG